MLKHLIPFVDLRGKTPIDLLRAYPDKAHSLIKAARRTYGPVSQAASMIALPLADRRSHRWLVRTGNPYLYEIECFADILGVRGLYALNLAYEWGCTSGVYATGESISMLRVLDWPFPALGHHVMVVLQSGYAGDFYNVTWPGLSGVYTAMAPGRFSAALNQAPMRRHNKTFVGDWVKNRRLAAGQNGLPPAHLLRQAFEQAKTYEEARQILTRTPVAMPVIFLLAGIKPGQGCLIERLEDAAEVTELAASPRISAANHFTGRFGALDHGWRPRAIDSHGRWRLSCEIHGHDLAHEHFDWLRAPIVNPFTRICCVSDAASRRLLVQGYEGNAQVTELFSLPCEARLSEPVEMAM